jgi:hypothetical protein
MGLRPKSTTETAVHELQSNLGESSAPGQYIFEQAEARRWAGMCRSPELPSPIREVDARLR